MQPSTSMVLVSASVELLDLDLEVDAKRRLLLLVVDLLVPAVKACNSLRVKDGRHPSRSELTSVATALPPPLALFALLLLLVVGLWSLLSLFLI